MKALGLPDPPATPAQLARMKELGLEPEGLRGSSRGSKSAAEQGGEVAGSAGRSTAATAGSGEGVGSSPRAAASPAAAAAAGAAAAGAGGTPGLMYAQARALLFKAALAKEEAETAAQGVPGPSSKTKKGRMTVDKLKRNAKRHGLRHVV